MTTFAIAGIQMRAGPSDNLDGMARLVETTLARFPWIEMVVFGELCAHGANPALAEALPGPSEQHLCSIARKHGIWLVPGSLYELDGNRIYNTAPVIDPSGDVVARHRKIYPFLPYEQGIDAGDQHTVFDVPGVGRFGLSICYDMWFPETTRAMAWAGAEVIIHPSLTNTIDRDLEVSIARASAGMNQCYFVDINNTGELGYGRSVVVGPEGEVIHEAGREAEVIPVVVDLDRVRRTRRDGLLGLGQVLKSFRDSTVAYPQYAARGRRSGELSSLGPLEKARRG
jgi:predicted amidohydrolase